MLISTTYAGTLRRCDGCGLDHIGPGDRVTWVHPGSIILAERCVPAGAEQLDQLALWAAARWESGAADVGLKSMLDLLD